MRPRAVPFSHRPGLLVAVTLLALASPAPLRAQPATAAKPAENTPRAHYQRGLNFYNVAEYDQAIAEFKKAYELSNAPELLFNIGQAYRLKGDCKQAVRVYRSFLRESASHANRSAAEGFIELCAKQDAGSVAVAPTAASPPGAAAAPSPVSAPVPDPAARPPVAPATAAPPPVASDPGALVPPPVASPALTLGSPGARVAVASPPAAPGRQKKLTGIIIASAGGAAILGGVVFGLAARGAQDDVRAVVAGPGEPVTWGASQSDRESAGKRAGRTAGVLLGLGAAAVVGGGVLYYMGHREAAGERLAAVPLPGGLFVALGGRL
jgi:hypothetical protein